MRGRVVTGNNYAHVWQGEHPEVLEELRAKLGWRFSPVPGTLNVEMDKDVSWDDLERIELDPGEGKPAFVVRATFRVAEEAPLPVGLVRLFATRTARNRVEIVSSIYLRQRFGLKDGDSVEVEW